MGYSRRGRRPDSWYFALLKILDGDVQALLEAPIFHGGALPRRKNGFMTADPLFIQIGPHRGKSLGE